jgi:hypothetical protein
MRVFNGMAVKSLSLSLIDSAKFLIIFSAKLVTVVDPCLRVLKYEA